MLGGPDAYGSAVDQLKYMVFSNPNWDWRTFNVAGIGSIDDAANFTCKCRRAFSLSVVRIEEAPVVVYRPISRNDSFTVTSNCRKLLYVAVPVIR